MQIHILASGSTGNAVFVQLGGTKLLVDAGISCRRIERGLAAFGVKVGDLDAILVTHEHTDHIKGLDVLVRKHQIPVYARERTWEKISFRDRLPVACCRELPHELTLSKIRVQAFNTLHDAIDPVGFCFHYRKTKWVVATDLGKVTESVKQALDHAEVVVLESNYDIHMLNTGSYPEFLKKRIRSPLGHLSNQDAAEALVQVQLKDGAHIFLAHLSQNNNRPDIAETTVTKFLTGAGYEIGRDIILHQTFPDQTASFI